MCLLMILMSTEMALRYRFSPTILPSSCDLAVEVLNGTESACAIWEGKAGPCWLLLVRQLLGEAMQRVVGKIRRV